jgi:glycosyltransferase involved in cell wall biosynthesis
MGIYDALNKGFKMAKGKIFAWLDSDNYYKLDITQKIVSILERQEDIDIIYGNVIIVKENTPHKDFITKSSLNFNDALLHNTSSIPVQPGVFFKRNVFERVNGFNIKYRIAGDYDFWLKALKNNPNMYYLNSVFGFYRVENNALSQSLKGIRNGFKEMYKIGKENNQTFHGTFILVKKYLLGYISTYIKNLKKNYVK